MRIVKDIIYFLGAGHLYHNLWWTMRTRKDTPWNEWNYAQKAIFVHIPKNAGTSLYKALNHPDPGNTHCPPQAYLSKDKEAFQSAKVFAVIRNPWDRAVSAFFYLKQKPLTADDKRWADENLENFDSFKDFAKALKNPFFAARVKGWRHFAPQWYYLTDNHKHIIVSELIKFENLDEDFKIFSKQLVGCKPIPKKNVSKRSGYRDYYDTETQRIISEFYKQDIKMLGYEF